MFDKEQKEALIPPNTTWQDLDKAMKRLGVVRYGYYQPIFSQMAKTSGGTIDQASSQYLQGMFSWGLLPSERTSLAKYLRKKKSFVPGL